MQAHFFKGFDAMAAECEHEGVLPEGCIRALWSASLIHDSAARAAIVLCSAAHMRFHQVDPFPEIYLHKLRGHILKCIRTALCEPKRCISDAMLVAVTSLAMSERLCGWHGDRAIHMRGLTRMIEARGVTMNKTVELALSCIWNLQMTQVYTWTSIAYSLPMSSFQTGDV